MDQIEVCFLGVPGTDADLRALKELLCEAGGETVWLDGSLNSLESQLIEVFRFNRNDTFAGVS